MTLKADFNAEDWSLILEGPPLAALRVIVADRGGTIRESLSIGKVYAEEQKNETNTELLDAIVEDRPEIDAKRFADPEQAAGPGMDRLAEALATVERAGTPAEVDDYRRFVYSVADRVARAHKEGGFLGIGGKEVSEDEQRALDEIAARIGYTPPAPPRIDVEG